MKYPNNFHEDYVPFKVKEHISSFAVGGIIVRLRFQKIKNFILTDIFFLFLFTKPYKDIYYWLPYRNNISSTKYSVTGSLKRFPFANLWLEVKETSEIYEQGLWNFIFKQKRLYKHTKEIRLALPFLANELVIVTRKKVIKTLDDFVFNKTTQQHRIYRIPLKK